MGPEASPGSQSLVECQCQPTVSKAGRLRALLLALSLIASSLFFFGGMPSSWWHLVPPSPPPKSVAAGSSVPKYVTTNIEDLRVGDWVLARNPEVTEEEREESPPLIEPDQWRKLTLRMEKPDGGQLDIELLRPAEWLEAVEAEPGAVLEVDLPELGAEGEAEILAVEPCPPIDAPPSPDCRVVTGRFRHASAEVLDLYVTGLPEPIGVTANHPFWSVDRQAFLPAGHLHAGERLRTADEQLCSVISLRPAPAQAVYNIEVDLEHVYFVSRSGILVHNACGKKTDTDSPPKGGTYKLINPRTGRVMRTGRTKNLIRRRAEHARDSGLKKYKFQVDRRTDSYLQQRGREQIIHDRYKPPLNKVRPISPTNPKRQIYLDAAAPL